MMEEPPLNLAYIHSANSMAVTMCQTLFYIVLCYVPCDERLTGSGLRDNTSRRAG